MRCQRRGRFAGYEPEAVGSGILLKCRKLGPPALEIAGSQFDLAKSEPSFKLNLGSVLFPCFFQNGAQTFR